MPTKYPYRKDEYWRNKLWGNTKTTYSKIIIKNRISQDYHDANLKKFPTAFRVS